MLQRQEHAARGESVLQRQEHAAHGESMLQRQEHAACGESMLHVASFSPHFLTVPASSLWSLVLLLSGVFSSLSH